MLSKSAPPGYADAPLPALPAPVAIPGQTNNFRANPLIRCPLPPMNSGPDDLRQFEDGNPNVPRWRVVPLPANNGLGGSTTINNTTVKESGGGSSSTGSLVAKSVSYKTALINPGSSVSASLTMAKSFQLISCSATGTCEIRLYGSSAAMSIDSSRPTDAPLAAELLNNIITDVVFDTAPYTYQWQNRVGVNSNDPQTTAAYLTVFNTGVAPAVIQVIILFLPLES